MKKISYNTTRHYLDERARWYIDEAIMPDGVHDYWLGMEGCGVQEYLFGDNGEGHLVTDPDTWADEITDYANTYGLTPEDLPEFEEV